MDRQFLDTTMNGEAWSEKLKAVEQLENWGIISSPHDKAWDYVLGWQNARSVIPAVYRRDTITPPPSPTDSSVSKLKPLKRLGHRTLTTWPHGESWGYVSPSRSPGTDRGALIHRNNCCILTFDYLTGIWEAENTKEM